MKKHRYPYWLKTLQRRSVRTLPKDTNISTYFEYKEQAFESMVLPDGRVMVRRVYLLGDGEIIDFGYQYLDGTKRTGINPMHIVKVYYGEPKKSELIDDLDIYIRLKNEKRGTMIDERRNDQADAERRL